MIQYVTIGEGARVGNLPSKLEVLKSLARNDHPISLLIIRADQLKMSDDDLGTLIVQETGELLDDVLCDINFARRCQRDGVACSI
jgi:hypothetical protein